MRSLAVPTRDRPRRSESLVKAVSRERPNSAVVIGLDTMQGLQTSRLLAGRGIEVHGVLTDGSHPFRRTHSCTSVSVAPTAAAIPDALAALSRRFDTPAVLYPCQDSAVRTISEHRAELKDGYIVVLPSHDVVTMLMEKSSFHHHAERNGLPVPRSAVLYDRSDAERAANVLTYPCALKPTSRSPEWSRHTNTKAFEVATPDELLATYNAVAGWVESMVVQEWVVGPDSLYEVV